MRSAAIDRGQARIGNGPQFIARVVRRWLGRVGVRTLYLEPGSLSGNGYIESFNGKLQDELLKREIFDTLLEAKVLVERWRQDYNQVRPHSALGYRPLAPETHGPLPPGSALRQGLRWRQLPLYNWHHLWG